MKKSLILSLALTLSVGLWAINGVKYIDADGQEKTANNVNVVGNSISQVTWDAGWYVVNGYVRLVYGAFCNGAVHLILADGAKLIATETDDPYYYPRPGIQVSGEGNSLTIYGQAAQTGQLIANGESGCAGIGGGKDESGTNITINGGIITATGMDGSAGIGGGIGGNGSNITINGGKITATAGDGGSTAIGGGVDGYGSNITVYSGLLIRAGNPPTEVIANTRTNTTDIASALAGKFYITITDGNTGDGTKTNPFLIRNYDELLEFSKQVNGGKYGSCARLEADIDATGSNTSWLPIGTQGKDYTGTFNGNGHIIKKLDINGNKQKNNIGLFGKIGTGAEVYGFGIVDGYFEGNNYVGAICGDFASGTIHDCFVVNTYVKGYNTPSGGLVGSHYYNAVLRDCYIYPHADHKPELAGVVSGTVYGNSDNCYYISDQDMESVYRSRKGDAEIIDIQRVSVEDAKSGVLCTLLNQYGSNGKHWYQTLGSDKSPVVDFTHGIVEWDGEKFINRSRDNVEITYTTNNAEPVNLRGGFGASELMGNYIISKNGKKIGVIVCDQPITAIDAFTFAQDSTLTAITLPESLYMIGDNAFASCTRLDEIVLGENVESIGEEAFMGCDALETAYIYAVQPPQLGSDGLGTGTAIHVIDASLYKQAEGWKNLNIVGDAGMMNGYKTARKDELIQATGASKESDIPAEIRKKYDEYAASIDNATTVAAIDEVCKKAIVELQEMAQLQSWKDNGKTMINY